MNNSIVLSFDVGNIRDPEISSSGTDWGVSTCDCNFSALNKYVSNPCCKEFKKCVITITLGEFIERYKKFFGLSSPAISINSKPNTDFKNDLKKRNPGWRITKEINYVWKHRTPYIEKYYMDKQSNEMVETAIWNVKEYFSRVFEHELYFILVPEEYDLTSIHNAKTETDYKQFIEKNVDKIIEELCACKVQLPPTDEVDNAIRKIIHKYPN